MRTILSLIICCILSSQTLVAQKLNGKYKRRLGMTSSYEIIYFKINGKYTREKIYDWGNSEVFSGKYIVNNDTLFLNDDSISKIKPFAKGEYLNKKFIKANKDTLNPFRIISSFHSVTNNKKKIVFNSIKYDLY